MAEDDTPRSCIFCESKDVTREHLWPDWVRNVLPSDEKLMHVHRAGQRKGPMWERNYPKLPFRVRLKIVCGDCNSRWMSRIEDAAKPIVLPLILGRGKELHAPAQTKLATWALLKAMVADFAGTGPRAIPQKHRADLRRSRGESGPFAHTRAWVAKYDGDRYPALSSVTKFALALTDPQGEVTDHDGYFATFSIGHLVVVVFGHEATVPMEFQLGSGLSPALHPIWPVQKTFIFPSRPRLTDAGLRSLSNRLF